MRRPSGTPVPSLCPRYPPGVSQLRTGSERSPCCKQCSCEPSCWREGSCCVDADHQPQNLTRKTYRYNSFSISGSALPYQPYLIIDTCPVSETNQTPVQNCGRINPVTFSGITSQSAKDGNVYNNRFCAQCNGQYNTTDWKLVLLDSDNLLSSLDVTKTPTDELFERCLKFVRFLPPDEMYTDSKCSIPSISSCNVTGLWQGKTNGDFIEKACNEPFLPYTEQLANGDNMNYSNEFFVLSSITQIGLCHCVDDDTFKFVDLGRKNKLPLFEALLEYDAKIT